MNEEQKAKEKADKLVLSFIHVDDRAMKKGSQSAWIDQILAKRCAIICCDEMIALLGLLEVIYGKNKKGLEFWQKVKEIINN